MRLDLTFTQVCELIKEEGKGDPKLIEAVDQLLGLILICSPAVMGPAAASVWPLLAVKNELVKVGKSILEKITKKKDGEYVARYERMQMAYGVLVFTAFFEALDRQIPKPLRERIRLLEREKFLLAQDATTKSIKKLGGSADLCERTDIPLAERTISFPHPTESLDHQAERHAVLWKQMNQGIQEFIQKLAIWEDATDEEQVNFVAALKNVHEESAKFFTAQYFELARRYDDFAVWANLQEHAKTKALVGELSGWLKTYSGLAKASEKSIDIGFAKLHAAVLDIPQVLQTSQATELVESLQKHYRARINDPIIEDKEEPQEGKPRLSFPRVRDAFIPQSFRVLRQTGRARRLEDEATWSELPRRNNLGAFMLSYLSSPYSVDSPLLILGHPGSGKSLLTTVLSSQLMSQHFTSIRVPLREVNAEAGIVAQIEEAIRRITNVSVDSWAKLSAAFKNNPPLVILDGYDELLQASGKVFSSYLKDVQNFQKNESEQGRPVRVIVTSRVTLIDKATVPSGATIIRLLEFDREQRGRWIKIWNRANVSYFRESEIEEFALPDEQEGGAEKVLNLAEQPLLLLMLALYDSQDNQLRRSKSLDRTKLYDSLLRRFVMRERGKEKGFDDVTSTDKKKALDNEMMRLGVAALGMYNRRKVHILSPELSEDLKFFSSERFMTVTSGKALSQADLLLGSFFFIHKSKAKHTAGAPEVHEENAAFEFLHNTFGEFLTADFILRRAFAEVEALQAFQQSEALSEDLEKRLNSADGFKREWFASLVYTPLFTRPVVLEMMREWAGHILRERNLSRHNFAGILDIIILNQLKRLLLKREMPSIIRKETAQEGYRAPFGDHPLLGHIAIYSMNLILLRVIVVEDPFVIDEEQIGTHEDGARPWDRLAHIWRSWFSLDNLSGITAVILASRKGNLITVQAKEKFQVAESRDRLETCLNVALSLGDNISSGLAGLLLFDLSKNGPITLDDIGERLSSENVDLGFWIAIRRLFQCERRIVGEDLLDYARLVREVLSMALRSDKREELENICLSFRRALKRLKYAGVDNARPHQERILLREAIPPELAADIAVSNPQAALVLCDAAREAADAEWSYRFAREVIELVFRRTHPKRIAAYHPEVWPALLQLARELVDGRIFGQFDRRMFHPEFFEVALDPHFLLELTQHSPDAALACVQLARELGGGLFIARHGGEVISRILDEKGLLDLSIRNPEVALTWVQIMRELGGNSFHEHYKETFQSELFKRVLNPGFLLDLSRRNAKAAIACVRLVGELAQYDYPGYGEDLIRAAVDTRSLFKLSEDNPEVALDWIRLVKGLGGGECLGGADEKIIPPKYFEKMLHPGYLMETAMRNPDAALATVQFVQELGGRLFGQRGEKQLKSSLSSRAFLDLGERHPEIALAMVSLAKNFALEDFLKREQGKKLIAGGLNLERLINTREKDLMATLAWLDFAMELGGGHLLEKTGASVVRLFDGNMAERFLLGRPAALVVILRLARLIASPNLSLKLAQSVESCLVNSVIDRHAWLTLPLMAFPDLNWLAEVTGNKRLLLEIGSSWLSKKEG